ncbi:Disease resistance protein [Corchorus capsularis]|uniref:Disease resistance protein n=1 Tax=Corchorus capsularis TaxID=210143 RepID=A0A1R3HZC9_COCAP|nr:Disease resistance protein [Corchorus capsularis]
MVGVGITFAATCTGALLGALLTLLTKPDGEAPKILKFFKNNDLKIEKLQELENSLLTVEKVLGDAEEKQVTNHSVQRWLDNLQDVAYDAGDLLDAIETEDRRGKQFPNVPTTEKQKRKFNEDLDAILKKLKSIGDQINVLGLKEGHGHGGRPFQRLPTTSLVDKSEACYRTDDRERILRLLWGDSEAGHKEISVIAIVGMGGMGKTTLTQFVYSAVKEEKEKKKKFDFTVWVSVSDEFDVFNVTKTIYESVIPSNSSIHDYMPLLNKDLNSLQVAVESRLRDQKILLVLDNIWNLSFGEWDLLRRPLQAADSGSKIIVTTRSRIVSSTMRSTHVHELNGLSDDDCQSLFEKHAFGNVDGDSTLKTIGVNISKKCKGLPLAAKTLGSLLRLERESEKWNNVLNSKIWDLPDDKSGILPALLLSYHHLPSHLKQCFAYCSLFPKGHKYQKGDLVRLWIAEGLVQQTRSKRRMEEIGESYFNELLSRSIFQSIKGKFEDETDFIMHDLVNDLAQHIAGEFCFKFEDDSLPQNPKRVRYLSCILEPKEMVLKLNAFEEVFKGLRLRTFLSLRSSSATCNPIFFQCPLFRESSSLRALSLSGYRICTLPDFFGNLKHLRYLDLSRNEIKTLPDGVVSLLNLETLKLSSCHELTDLPTNMKNLTKLEHLDIKGTRLREMPQQFGALKHLKLLTNFIVGSSSGSSRISEVKELSLLRGTLSITGLQNVTQTEDAKVANLEDKRYLRELIFEWDAVDPHNGKAPNAEDANRPNGNETNNFTDQNTQNAEDVLALLKPTENLECLTIKKFCGRNFPDWLGNSQFSKIERLFLIDCPNCSSVQSLEQLPSLKKLDIYGLEGVEQVGPEFYGPGLEAFKSLESLRFEKMINWSNRSPPQETGSVPFNIYFYEIVQE